MAEQQSSCGKEFLFVNYEDDSDFFHVSVSYRDSNVILRKLSIDMTVGEVLNLIKSSLKRKLETKNMSSDIIVVATTVGYRSVDDSESFKIIVLNRANYLIRINGIIYTIRMNISRISSIKFPNPNQIFIGLPVCPDILDVITLMPIQNKCTLYWYIQRSTSGEWEYLGKGDYYTPTQRDINGRLKVKAVPDDCDDPNYAVTETSGVILNNQYEFPFKKRQQYTREYILNDRRFRLVTYNILAFATGGDSFLYCPAKAKDINYRKVLIREELRGYRADIVCMQEVLNEVLENELRAKLDTHYKYIFSKRGNDTKDGLACIYNSSKFSLINHIVLNYAEDVKTSDILSGTWNLISKNKAIADVILKRPDIAQILLFRSNQNANQILIVANLHLWYHFSGDYVRLWQVVLAVEYVKYVYEQIKNLNNRRNISVVFCGDFNSKPLSEVFKYLISKNALINLDPSTPFNNIILQHPFNFESAYGVPKFTNHCIEFTECIDYIFYDRDTLSIIQNVPLPTEKEITANGGLPSVVFPSDHLPLITDFQFKNVLNK